MKILLYIEPYPIRNSSTSFAHLFDYFSQFLQSNFFDARVYANSDTLESLKNKIPNNLKKRIIKPTKTEDLLCQKYLADWNTEGMQNWINLLKGGSVVDEYVAVLQRIWELFSFDIIIYWGENKAVTTFCDRYSLTKISMELGCTRPPFFKSLTLDPFGSNGNAILPQLDINAVRDIVDNVPMSSYEALYLYSENIESKPYEDFFNPINKDLYKEFSKNKKYAFLPLQLYDDANLLLFSKFKNIKDVVLNSVPLLVENGYTVIIKPHPGVKQRPNAQMENNLAQAALAPWKGGIFWCDNEKNTFNNASIFNLVDFVVTVNSSVGFEALYFDKVVIPLGKAIYTPQGVFPSLEDVIKEKFDRKKYFHNIGIIRRFVLESSLFPFDMLFKGETLYNRICSLDVLRKDYSSDIKKIAQNYYKMFSPIQKNHFLSKARSGNTQPGIHDFNLYADIYTKTFKGSNLKPTESLIGCVTQIIQISKKENFKDFSKWLEQCWDDEALKKQLLLNSQLLDPVYYIERYPDIQKENMDPTLHYIQYGVHELRSPRAGVEPKSGDELSFWILQTAKKIYEVSSNKQILLEYEQDQFLGDLKNIAHVLYTSRSQIAVVAHMYYKDLVSEILECIHNISEPFDLIITLPQWGNKSTIEQIRKTYPNALFCRAPNRGRDIGPFIGILPLLLQKKYELILKLQTKRGCYFDGQLQKKEGHIWRKLCLKSLLGDKNLVSGIITAFRLNPNLNMVGPKQCYLPLKKYPYPDGGRVANAFLKNHQFHNETGFFAGSMFWIRPQALAPLVSEHSSLSIYTFDEGYSSNNNNIAHTIERFFGELALANQGQIGTVDVTISPYEIDLDPTMMKQSIWDYLVNTTTHLCTS